MCIHMNPNPLEWNIDGGTYVSNFLVFKVFFLEYSRVKCKHTIFSKGGLRWVSKLLCPSVKLFKFCHSILLLGKVISTKQAANEMEGDGVAWNGWGSSVSCIAIDCYQQHLNAVNIIMNYTAARLCGRYALVKTRTRSSDHYKTTSNVETTPCF